MKDTAELPWEIRKCWKAFDGQRHQEVKLQLEQVFETKRRRQEDMDELPLGALSNLPEALRSQKGHLSLKGCARGSRSTHGGELGSTQPGLAGLIDSRKAMNS